MIGQALAHGDNSVTAATTISAASVTAIAATVVGKDDAGITGSIVFAPFGIQRTLAAVATAEHSTKIPTTQTKISLKSWPHPRSTHSRVISDERPCYL